MAAPIDKSKPYFPLAGSANDGWSKDNKATATCYCGAVQLAFVSLVACPTHLGDQYLPTAFFLHASTVPQL